MGMPASALPHFTAASVVPLCECAVPGMNLKRFELHRPASQRAADYRGRACRVRLRLQGRRPRPLAELVNGERDQESATGHGTCQSPGEKHSGGHGVLRLALDLRPTRWGACCCAHHRRIDHPPVDVACLMSASARSITVMPTLREKCPPSPKSVGKSRRLPRKTSSSAPASPLRHDLPGFRTSAACHSSLRLPL